METVWAWLETQTNADVVALIQREYTAITYAWCKHMDGKHVHVYNAQTKRGISLYQGPAGDKGGLAFHLLDEHAGTHQLYYTDKQETVVDFGLLDGGGLTPSDIDGFYVHDVPSNTNNFYVNIGQWRAFAEKMQMVPLYGTLPIESVYHDALRALL